ncbi:hypothetical protein J8I26_11275 [Herbaspirillum sp. LeCh32-8]|uniref:hypothetical protein n=1 Tax=Herbaspirillum sp. LeCh32-8 TaxID=2821356 RepID=UPI001AE5AB92|nr:hypothetical protein [Herbaspirillum sp. LeCh32-8]MBP0598690.1 hypothetical protein [Herbaspirillum sp. LeCh32-8]
MAVILVIVQSLQVTGGGWSCMSGLGMDHALWRRLVGSLEPAAGSLFPVLYMDVALLDAADAVRLPCSVVSFRNFQSITNKIYFYM